LAALKGVWEFGKEVFGDKSEELRVLLA
jgi:hypothetical protein